MKPCSECGNIGAHYATCSTAVNLSAMATGEAPAASPEPTNEELAHWLDLHTEGRRAYPPSHAWYRFAATRLRALYAEPTPNSAVEE